MNIALGLFVTEQSQLDLHEWDTFLVCMLTLYLILWSISTTFGHNYDFNILYSPIYPLNPFSDMIHV